MCIGLKCDDCCCCSGRLHKTAYKTPTDLMVGLRHLKQLLMLMLALHCDVQLVSTVESASTQCLSKYCTNKHTPTSQGMNERNHRRMRRGRAGGCPPPKKKKTEKFFSGNYYVKFGHFSGKNHVKLGNFVNFSGTRHKNSGILIFFHTYSSGKNVVPPKVD